LSNNLDRHSGNLIISNKPDRDGINNIVPIDHERNFQYQRSANFHWNPETKKKWGEEYAPETLADYENGNAFQRMQNLGMFGLYHFDSVYPFTSTWWKKHRDGIVSAMDHNLQAIKSDELKNHIRDHFMERVRYMDQWSKNIDSQAPDNVEVKPVKIRPIEYGGRRMSTEEATAPTVSIKPSIRQKKVG
jgi:hypothetical protein